MDQASGAIYVAGFSQTSSSLTELVLIKYTEPTPLPVIQKLDNGYIRLQFRDAPGQLCLFEASNNLDAWAEVGSAVADAQGVCRFDDTNAPAYSQRFYRRVPP